MVRDQRLKETAYMAIVRPTLEYCSSVWDPHTYQMSRRLEMVQRRASRWVTGRYHNTSSVTDMLADLGWRELAQRQVDARLAMTYKITHGLVDIPVGQYITFHRDRLHISTNLCQDQLLPVFLLPQVGGGLEPAAAKQPAVWFAGYLQDPSSHVYPHPAPLILYPLIFCFYLHCILITTFPVLVTSSMELSFCSYFSPAHLS